MTDHLSHGEKLLEFNGVELCFGPFAIPALAPLCGVVVPTLLQHTAGGRA